MQPMSPICAQTDTLVYGKIKVYGDIRARHEGWRQHRSIYEQLYQDMKLRAYSMYEDSSHMIHPLQQWQTTQHQRQQWCNNHNT